MTSRDAPVRPAPQRLTPDLTGYEVVVGVTGGIAAYKACSLVSALVQRGAGVTCVMTRAARRFVGPVTFEALSGREVLKSLWGAELSHDPQHIHLSQRADLFVIAPATANILAKIANGLADDLLSTLMTAATRPVLLAPAMNTAMWANAIVQQNVIRLREAGYLFVGPNRGWQACRAEGEGRMAEPEEILQAAVAELTKRQPSAKNDSRANAGQSESGRQV